MPTGRRDFIRTAASGAALLGLPAFPALPAVPRQDPRIPLDPGLAPLVRLLEETSRDTLIEEVAARIRNGLGYKELLGALMLAAVRNVQPRPSVGFKFHAVLVVNSVHLASLSSPERDRWLPLLWAVDHFKGSQADEKQKGGWTMKPVDESAVPPPHKARKAFIEALDAWDETAADAAAAGLARGAGAHETFELLARYGARDFRSIGHKAIFTANGWRTLECMGWAHAEPVLRSLARAFTAHEGQNPANGDAPADRPLRRNLELARTIREEWRGGKTDPAAAADLLAALRQASDEEASKTTVELLNRGVAPQSVWDGLFLASAELLMRRPNIQSLHAVTTLNALRYAFDTVAGDETRRLLLLQAAAFLPLFRGDPAKLRDVRIDRLEAAAPTTVQEVFADVPKDRQAAAQKALGFLASGKRAADLIDAARVLVFLKGHDSHDYKFSSAVLEDYAHVSPEWRDRFLASSLFYLRGTGSQDNGLVDRIRAALKA